jgi:DNA mismatch repair protein MutS2
MNNSVLRTLEYDKIIDLLTAQAGSGMARERIGRMKPLSNKRAVRDALTETTEAVSVILYKGSIPIGDLDDISGLVSFARKGRCLNMREILTVRKSLAYAREVKTFLSSDVPEIPVIAEMADLLEPVPALEHDIERCILSEDEMADSASPALRRIRREIRNKNESIKSRLGRLTSSGNARTYLQDAIVTMRNGRYVIPVKKEYSSLVPGMVHDQSKTGATLFIEPQAVVNMNNELRELEAEEENEINRILQAFSDRIAEHYHDLINNQELLVKLDVINAKGRLSRLMDGSEPHINTDGIIDIRGGRHPLIPEDRVVPIDVRLGKDFKTLLITGPNTGGKTVTLKTIGLFVLMTETGFHVPCYETSEIALFDEVYADIGDEQSIEQSLSTFSAHMMNIVEIFRHAGSRSLVLLDELGAGTDPAEGAALGIAELEKLREQGAYVVATTHYTELKKYALSTEDVENASMEFDVETLSPTYRLRIGLPGKSSAFEISKKLGLDEDIIARASQIMGSDELSFEDAVTRVEADRKKSEDLLAEAERTRKESEEKLREAEALLEDAESQRTKIIEKAREDARDIVRGANDTVEEVRRELKAARRGSRGRETAVIADSRRRLREAERKNMPKPAARKKNDRVPSPDELVPGTRVKLLTIDQNGVVESGPDDRGNLTVRIGALKTSANIGDLMIIDDEPQGNKKKKRKQYTKISTRKAKSISPSVNVIGKNLDDAEMIVGKYLDDAFLSGLKQVQIIHGRGAGILRDGIRDMLRRDKRVKKFEPAPYNQGGDGVTVVTLKND